jgi:hypothetical protein
MGIYNRMYAPDEVRDLIRKKRIAWMALAVGIFCVLEGGLVWYLSRMVY